MSDVAQTTEETVATPVTETTATEAVEETVATEGEVTETAA